MAVPQVRVYAIQGIVLSGKIRFLHVGCAEKPAIERVGPAVIWALDAAFEVTFRGGTDACAAMPANVVKGVHASARIARDNDALAGNFTKHVIAGTWNLALSHWIYTTL